MIDEQFIRAISIRWDRIEPDSYIRDIPALADMAEMTFSTPITFFVGENGSGKSTLLEAIAVASGFNPEGGTKNYCFSTYDSHSDLHEALFVTRGIRKPGWGYFLRAESFYNVATMDEEYGKLPGGVSHDFHKKSHGESFLATVQENFKPNGLYILDEPLSSKTAHTSARDQWDRKPGIAVHYRDPFADFARDPGCTDIKLRQWIYP